MQIFELEVGESVAPAEGVRVTVVGVVQGRARLKIESPAHVVVTVGEPKEVGLKLVPTN